MLEKNKDKLSKLLSELPVYQPPGEVWEQIEQSFPEKSATGLERLQQYEPPDRVWTKIESALNQKTPKPRPYLLWISAAAAAVTALVWLVWAAAPLEANSGATVSGISFSREFVDASLLQRDWEQDDEDFELVSKLCAATSFTCANPDMQTLQMELEELTDAKEALEKALGKYGADADMIAQLAQIERRRTAILKRMLDYFL
jgi:hypothetical protein